MKDSIIWKHGQPCNHRGCLAHITKPCEGCGRIGGQGAVHKPLLLDEIIETAQKKHARNNPNKD